VNKSDTPARTAQTRPLGVANARRSPSYGCVLRLDWARLRRRAALRMHGRGQRRQSERGLTPLHDGRPASVNASPCTMRSMRAQPAAGLAHAARPRGRDEHATRQVACAEAPRGVAEGLHLGMCGRVVVQDDAARRFADDRIVAPDDGAVGLVAAALRLVAQLTRSGHRCCERRGVHSVHEARRHERQRRVASRQRHRYLSSPSTFIASCTAGRAATRAM
jgi:hypothetical protein